MCETRRQTSIDIGVYADYQCRTRMSSLLDVAEVERCSRGPAARPRGGGEPGVEDLSSWASEVRRKLSASTLASFQRRAPVAVAASAQSAARTPATLLAAIEAPVPVQQQTTACAARPAATSRAAASEAHAQSSERPANPAPRRPRARARRAR